MRNDGRNCLYFYPKEYIDEAAKRGLADPAATMAKGKRFMIPFCIFMLLALLAILVFWNRVTGLQDRLWAVGAVPGGDELVRRAGH